MSAPKKFKSALKKLCDRAKSALNSQARISSPELQIKHTLIYKIMTESEGLGSDTLPATNKTYTNIQNNG